MHVAECVTVYSHEAPPCLVQRLGRADRWSVCVGAARSWYATYAALAATSAADPVGTAAGMPPVDSMNMWPTLSTGAPSPRTELFMDASCLCAPPHPAQRVSNGHDDDDDGLFVVL